MKKEDFYIALLLMGLFLPFIVMDPLYRFYLEANHDHGLAAGFLKFAILATIGEMIGNRIRLGRYLPEGFGMLPKSLIWGVLGIGIKMAFDIFSAGTPRFLATLGFDLTNQPQFPETLGLAFATSMAMNLVFAPGMMLVHKITDVHVASCQGRLAALWQPIRIPEILNKLDWSQQWNFVFKRTILLFWIPAHTITFLLSPDFRVLFAALLGIALGILLAIAGNKPQSIA